MVRLRRGGRTARWSPSGLVAALVACLTAAGCAYWTERYYEPSAPGGRLVRPYCGGSVGPRNTLDFTLGDVGASVFAYQNAEQLSVGMSFSVPAGRVVRLIEDRAVVRLNGRPEALVAAFGEIRSSGPDRERWTLPATAPMAGASQPAVKGSSQLGHRSFVMRATVTTAERTPFTVDFPRFAIDEQPMTVPRIEFAPKRWHTIFMPINC
jgi:hypothetical protein